jgi:tRNA-splicing ligase RtcB
MPIQTLIEDTPVPVKIWTDDVEELARRQLRNTATLPFVYHHVAAMPDVHLGIGATVGSVIATRGAICPAAVGVDIGCGMIAQKTSLHADDLSASMLKNLRTQIERSVPVGPNSHKKPLREAEAFFSRTTVPSVSGRNELDKALCQLGTLGGGNHFIEVCLDDADQMVWLLLHSGSRHIGNKVAERHINKARGLMARLSIDLADRDLAYFVEQQPEFDAYMRDLEWCQDYARANRELMMNRVVEQFARLVHKSEKEVVRGQRVNCHHNYVSRERHFGEDVLVTRKGAIRAGEGELGIIPGSMGTGSYIVRGKGNPDSFESAPHGAGRRMSRGEARRRFTRADLVRMTEGVECRKDEGVLDEIPAAYKEITDVIEKSSDLVEVVASIKQVVCVKG